MEPLPVAALVVASAAKSGISMPRISRSRKWFTMYMRPVGEAPAGRSRVHSANWGSVVSKGVSKK